MQLTIDNQAELLSHAALMANVPRWAADAEAVGIHAKDETHIRGVFVMSHFTNGECLINFVSDERKDWASPTLFYRLAAYLFEHKGLDRLVASISANNVPSLIMAIKTGMQIEARLRCGAIDGSDAILFSMLRDESPWMKDDDDERTSA